METKLGVYKRSRETVLTNLNQRLAVLHRSTEKEGRVLPFGLVIALKYQFMVTFWSIQMWVKKRSGKGKENEKWILWMCSLCSVPYSTFFSVNVKATCAKSSTCLLPFLWYWGINILFFDQLAITTELKKKNRDSPIFLPHGERLGIFF